VREALVTLIEALAPTTLATETFRRYKLAQPFADAMQDDPAHCFRVFDLRFGPAPAAPMVVNGDEGRWRYPFMLEIAYPRVHYKAVADTLPVLTMDQIADEDAAKILPVLRDYAGATWVAQELRETRATDREITTLTIESVFEMWRTV
jgi:hypothetical protein